jgi:VanZ family protein
LLGIAALLTLYEATIRHPVEMPHVDNADKMLHAFTFFCLAALKDMAFPNRRHLFRKVLGLMAFGVLIEVIQSWLPWRSADITDFLADCTGITLYLVPSLLSRLVVRLHHE